ncbi:hypothetical protein NIES4103_51690 [Nostoc sp. NIES-4103]|nr:hypothetical protein NIES4103_51690 [Nostoc sp. NIES-4103]
MNGWVEKRTSTNINVDTSCLMPDDEIFYEDFVITINKFLTFYDDIHISRYWYYLQHNCEFFAWYSLVDADF